MTAPLKQAADLLDDATAEYLLTIHDHDIHAARAAMRSLVAAQDALALARDAAWLEAVARLIEKPWDAPDAPCPECYANGSCDCQREEERWCLND